MMDYDEVNKINNDLWQTELETESKKMIDSFLTQWIYNSPRCRMCHFLHYRNDIGYYCFFASGCFKGLSFEYYMPKEEKT